MPNPPDPRWGYPSPTGGDDADVPADIGRLHDRMIAVGATITQSAGAAPTNAVGHLHWQTAGGGVLLVGEGDRARPVYGLPIGLPLPWPVDELPQFGDWVRYDGTLYPQQQYPDLFAVLGRRYTSGGVNASLFAVPNYSARALIGPGNGRSTGETVGVERYKLTAAQSGTPDHVHHMETIAQGGNPPPTIPANGRQYVRGSTAIGGGGTDLSVPITNQGSFSYGMGVAGIPGGARNAAEDHSVMQPSIVVNWIARSR